MHVLFKIKVSILQYRDTLLQVIVRNSKCARVKVQKYWLQNGTKSKSTQCPIPCPVFKYLLKIADLIVSLQIGYFQTAKMYRAEVVTACFVIIIRIYKVVVE